ncbi:hypothetical protein M0D69_29450 [Caballeronia sp. SEWSISQ10-4 2]|uniref:hypothetical protein n=1 Tax=Caballeronia sp. SEWSISQ10-4 2 TaxID=2937438 RepID=UPI00264FB950|nr:hypothetical protein [Caballeronia sp. SEWSISQ10-4 2]MDN7182066.1 hypothetical protein [Caballeronia sp. SEWSISQ10-4 2]
MTKPFWIEIKGPTLAQGDLLEKCLVPQFGDDFGSGGEGSGETVPVGEANLIIVTQSCDLENGKVELVAMCPAYTLAEFEEQNPAFKNKGRWEEVRKGRIEGLHLLGSPADPSENQGALVVDFGQIFSLPTGYLAKRADSAGTRWRLDSPFLEHFSQAFARYFMRVGLPSQIPQFK